MKKKLQDYLGLLSDLIEKKYRLFLILIMLIGFAFRFSGIVSHYDFPLGVDTSHFVQPVLQMMETGSLNPDDFYYGNLAHYLILISFYILNFIGFNVQKAPLYYANILAVIAGTLSILFVYFLGKELKDRKTGLLAAFLAAVMPYHLYRSVFINGDIFGFLFAAIALIYIAKINKTERFSSRHFLLAGIFGGLAASSKYTYGFVLIFFIIFYLFKSKFIFFRALFKKRFIVHKGIIFCGIAFLLAFVLTSPYAFINYKTTKSIQDYNMIHFKEGSHSAQNSYADNSLFKFPYARHSYLLIPLVYYPLGLGIGIYFLFVLAIIFFIHQFVKHKKLNIFILSSLIFILLMYFYFAPSVIFHVRYLFPLFVFCIILSALFIKNIENKYLKLFAIICIFYNFILVSSISYSYLINTRAELDNWLKENIKQNETIAGYEHPFDKNKTIELAGSGQVKLAVWKYWLNVKELREQKPDCIILTSKIVETHIMDSTLDPSGQSKDYIQNLFKDQEGYILIKEISTSYFSSQIYHFLRREWGDTYKDESDESNYFIFKKKKY